MITFWVIASYVFIPFQACVAFNIKKRYLIDTENQITGFYIENNTGPKWVKNGHGTSCQFSKIFRKALQNNIYGIIILQVERILCPYYYWINGNTVLQIIQKWNIILFSYKNKVFIDPEDNLSQTTIFYRK